MPGKSKKGGGLEVKSSAYTPYKMRGPSLYSSSPAKQAPEKKKKGFPSETTKSRDLKKEETVGDIGDQINFLGEDLFQDRISKEQHDAKVKILRAKEKAAINANKLR